ncbi:hypothetical protein QM012_003072 [Aureobasidium pullulans]|uniref:Uncharacterized protein n=1 Tax=Aureobasidium pullulans TaxID=5580 RepID=A0ABR0T9C9_AURPU
MSGINWSAHFNRLVDWIDDGEFARAESHLQLLRGLSTPLPPYYGIRCIILIAHCVEDRALAKNLAWQADVSLHHWYMTRPAETTTASGRRAMDKLLRQLDKLDEKLFADQTVDDDYPGILVQNPGKSSKEEKETTAKVEERDSSTTNCKICSEQKRTSQHTDGKKTALARSTKLEREQEDDDFTFFLRRKVISKESKASNQEPPPSRFVIRSFLPLHHCYQDSPADRPAFSSSDKGSGCAICGNINIYNVRQARTARDLAESASKELNLAAGSALQHRQFFMFGTLEDTPRQAERKNEDITRSDAAPVDSTSSIHPHPQSHNKTPVIRGPSHSDPVQIQDRKIAVPGPSISHVEQSEDPKVSQQALPKPEKVEIVPEDVPKEPSSDRDASDCNGKEMNVSELLHSSVPEQSLKWKSPSSRKVMLRASVRSSRSRPRSLFDHTTPASAQIADVSFQAEAPRSASRLMLSVLQPALTRSSSTPLLSTPQNARSIQKNDQGAAQISLRSPLVNGFRGSLNDARDSVRDALRKSTLARSLTQRGKRRPDLTAGSVVGDGSQEG